MTTATCDARSRDRGDLGGDAGHDVRIDTDRAAAEHLTGELEQHPVARRSTAAVPIGTDARHVPAPVDSASGHADGPVPVLVPGDMTCVLG